MKQLSKIIVFTVAMLMLLGLNTHAATSMETDIVVVGAGGAGISAALEATAKGADVILLEKMPFPGGSTMLSGGIIYGANTSVQQSVGIEDSADAMYEYWMTINQWNVDPALNRIVADQSGPAIEWLIELGVEFPAEQLYVSGVESVKRAHTPVDAGRGFIKPLVDAVNANQKINMMLETPATDLLVEDGQVVGVVAEKEDGTQLHITAGAVVLATGGFGHNEELMRRHLPEVFAYGSRYLPISIVGATGDGILMGQKLGADVVGMDRALTLVKPVFQDGLVVGLPGWLVYVNKSGQRFVNELAPYAVMSGVCDAQDDGLVWAILDQAALEASNWPKDAIQSQANKVTGIGMADTLQELAVKLGINPQGLENAMARYNQDVEQGKDTAFLKDPSGLVPVKKGPFYGVQIVPAILALTSGGLRITPQTEVLTVEGTTIPGLYAAGETTGNVIGDRYPGGGSAIADAIVFGRIAGQEAADFVSGNK